MSDDPAISAIRELRAKITPGPWEPRDEGKDLPASIFTADAGEHFIAEVYGPVSGDHLHNAAFLAAAPAAIDTLLASHDEMRARIGELCGVLAVTRGWLDSAESEVAQIRAETIEEMRATVASKTITMTQTKDAGYVEGWNRAVEYLAAKLEDRALAAQKKATKELPGR